MYTQQKQLVHALLLVVTAAAVAAIGSVRRSAATMLPVGHGSTSTCSIPWRFYHTNYLLSLIHI